MKIKKQIHKSRLLAFTDEKLLVLEKVGLKKRYSLPGGVQKKRETDCHSLIRETEEEVGVQLEKEDLSYLVSRSKKTVDKRIMYKHYFFTNKKIDWVELQEPEKFKGVHWIPWYETLEYLDKEDRSAVVLYCNEYRREAN